MNIKKVIATASLLALTGSVFANDLLPFSEADHFVSTKTRAEVKAEVMQAVRSGELVAHGDVTPAEQFAVNSKSVRSRAETRTEAADAARNQHGNADRPIGG